MRRGPGQHVGHAVVPPGQDLTRYFPELASAIAAAVPPGVVIDGEAVIWSGGQLDFSALQQRLSAGVKTLPGMVRETPANYVAFDILAVAGMMPGRCPWRSGGAFLNIWPGGWWPEQPVASQVAWSLVS